MKKGAFLFYLLSQVLKEAYKNKNYIFRQEKDYTIIFMKMSENLGTLFSSEISATFLVQSL